MLRGRSQEMQWKWASSCLRGGRKELGELLGGDTALPACRQAACRQQQGAEHFAVVNYGVCRGNRRGLILVYLPPAQQDPSLLAGYKIKRVRWGRVVVCGLPPVKKLHLVLGSRKSTEWNTQTPPPLWELLPWAPTALQSHGNWGCWQGQNGGVPVPLAGVGCSQPGSKCQAWGLQHSHVLEIELCHSCPRTATRLPQPHRYLQKPAAACGCPEWAGMRGERHRRPRLPSEPALAPVSLLHQR